MNSGMSRASSAEKYDAKEAYNKDLTSKARMHYLENDIADKKGMSRQASPLNDFKGGYHKVQHAKGEAHKSPAKNITYGDKSGPTGYIGEQRADDMKYNPVDDRAGMSRKDSKMSQEEAKRILRGDSKELHNRKKADAEAEKKRAKKMQDQVMAKKPGVSRYKSDAQRKAVHASKADGGMSRQKYGGNKGDERRSAAKDYDSPASIRKSNSSKKDYDGMSRYGGNKGDIKRSAKKDY
tara:strand:- start:787 stop:1497 length:711 start_codon:yes stop_codon:yes gene_type:complete